MPEREEKTAGDERSAMAMIFGVTAQSQPVVEALHFDHLDALNVHFERYPYLRAGAPASEICLLDQCTPIWGVTRTPCGSCNSAPLLCIGG